MLDVLLVTAGELETWKASPFDEAELVRAHGHVVAMRAAHERGSVRRTLVTGALRSSPVASYLRTGQRVDFMHHSEVPRYVAEVARTRALLPAHPFLRAAWIIDVLGVIHPFVDSNGGTARFMGSLELTRAWLPPLALSWEQRNGSFLVAIVTHDLAMLELVVYRTVQQELARLLLVGDAWSAAWDDRAAGRAGRWTALTDAAWARATGAPTVVDSPGAAGFARLARRGYRLPRATPHCLRWRVPGQVPVQIELAVASVRGGPSAWTIAVLGGSVGDDGALGPVIGPGAGIDEVSPVFVAAASELEADVDARFERWLDARIAQCTKGLSAWM
ncbi:MAG: Fic family protein [Kofleriaceae bacterium]|nr:Fic family protein [Kofleriaceae bacterium]